jgi:hypothetical protein
MAWPFRKPFVAERAYHIEFGWNSAVMVLGHRGDKLAVKWFGSVEARTSATDRMMAKWWKMGLEPVRADRRTRELKVAALPAKVQS